MMLLDNYLNRDDNRKSLLKLIFRHSLVFANQRAVAVLSNSLRACPILEELDLSNTQLHDDGVAILAEGLKGASSTFHSLILTRNWIGNDGVNALAELLEMPSCGIDSLRLDENARIGDVAAERLALALRRTNRTLLKLDLRGDSLTVRGGRAFLKAIYDIAGGITTLRCCNHVVQSIDLSLQRVEITGGVNLVELGEGVGAAMAKILAINAASYDPSRTVHRRWAKLEPSKRTENIKIATFLGETPSAMPNCDRDPRLIPCFLEFVGTHWSLDASFLAVQRLQGTLVHNQHRTRKSEREVKLYRGLSGAAEAKQKFVRWSNNRRLDIC